MDYQDIDKAAEVFLSTLPRNDFEEVLSEVLRVADREYNCTLRMGVGYNGYTNKPTWVVVTWLLNSEKMYRRAMACKSPEELKEWIESDIIFDEANLYSDLLEWVLAWVDWQGVYDYLHEEG